MRIRLINLSFNNHMKDNQYNFQNNLIIAQATLFQFFISYRSCRQPKSLQTVRNNTFASNIHFLCLNKNITYLTFLVKDDPERKLLCIFDMQQIKQKQMKGRERPKSAPKTQCTHNKPLMQAHYKPRVGSRNQIIDASFFDQPGSYKIDNPQSKQLQIKQQKKSKRSNSLIIQHTTSVDFSPNGPKNSSMIITNQNFKHHHQELCVCSQCNCGRHLCKLHTVSPNLTKKSTYHNDYRKKSTTPNKVVIAEQYPKLEGPTMQLNSTYFKQYPDKRNDDLSRPKPQDLLKTGGPCANLTSYSAEFPGHRGANQYVKPTDKHRRQKFPLRGRTTYQNTFKEPPKLKDDWEGIHDNLKTGTGWFGNTTYNQDFKNPKRQNYPTHVKIVEKRQINPDYIHQYQTSYKNQFIRPPTAVCPAKITLQTKKLGEYRSSKIKFKENSDYKSMSPQFRSYSANRCH